MLTANFAFQPDDVIEIDGVVYAVFFDTDEALGDFPILAKVDSLNFLREGTVPTVLTEEEFASKYGYVFRGHEDLKVSDIQTRAAGQDPGDYRSIMDVAEAQLEEKAKNKGMSWLLDQDVQLAFLAATLTGVPVSESDLADTNWYQSTTPDERKFLVEFYSDPQGVEEKTQANISSILSSLNEKKVRGNIEALATTLAFGITSRKYNAEEADIYIDYIRDNTLLNIVGGEQMLPEDLRQFVGMFPTTDGLLLAEQKVRNKLGPDAVERYRQSGQLLQMAGLIRNNQGDVVDSDLQLVHDTLYPSFKGSSYGSWQPYFTSRASKIIYGTGGTGATGALSIKDQEKINDLIIDSKGDYSEFDKLVRKGFIDAPGVKNDFLNQLTRVLPQAVSGVF
jgi:hypothetical protein